jgi:hypothetical protein
MAFEVNVNLRDQDGEPLNLEHPLHKAAIGHGTQPIDDTVRQLVGIPNGAKYAVITVELPEGKHMRFWLDGSTPSASEGHRRPDDAAIILTAELQLTGFRYVRADDADGQLQISYF